MKRKRKRNEEKKKLKKIKLTKFYLFIDIVSIKDGVKIRLFDNETKIIGYFKEKFKTWGYSICKSGEGEKKIISNNLKSIVIVKKNENLSECQFESNIPKIVRYVTSKNLKFLDPVIINNDKLEKYSGCEKFEFPINFIGNSYIIDQDYNLSSKIIIANDHMIIGWDRWFGKIAPSLLFKNLLDNFIVPTRTNTVTKMKISPKELYQMSRNDEEVIKKNFEIFFPQVLYICSIVAIPLRYLFEVKHSSMIPDFVFLANKPENVICAPPRDLPRYKANPFIDTFGNFLITEKVVSLDYDSMFISSLLCILENIPEYRCYYEFAHKLLSRKRTTNSLIIKESCKLALNVLYGSFGVSNKNVQFLICPNIKIADQVCKYSRNLMLETSKYFGNVVYANTDSIVIHEKKKFS